MRPEERQKICNHCEGRIAVEADTCLYCGTPLTSSHSSAYSHPYVNRNVDPMKEKDSLQKFKTPLPRDPLLDASFGKMPYQPEVQVAALDAEEEKTSLLPILLVLLGSTSLTLGLMQGLFSEGGVLRLEWTSKYWFVYCLIALPLMYWGVKKSKQGKEAL